LPIASNFAILGSSEIICRAVSLFVALTLAKRLGKSGFGRIEFAFNLVYWLVLVLRDGFETIITREVARHTKLTRHFVNRVLSIKLTAAVVMLGGLSAVALTRYSSPEDGALLVGYGLLLVSTAIGLDYVFRGLEEPGVVGVSLVIRTVFYTGAVWLFVKGESNILLVPVFLALGEFTGIAMVWSRYAARFGLPRPVVAKRFLLVLLRRSRWVATIHVCQAVILSSDLLVVGLMSRSSDFGEYGASHKIVAALMAFGIIFQQVTFPSFSRAWRASPEEGGRQFDLAVGLVVAGSVPVAVGGSLLAQPVMATLLPADYTSSGLLLAVGLWRVPFLTLALLYQTTMIAMNRERAAVRILVGGAAVSMPCIAAGHWAFGLAGASVAVASTALGLVVASYRCLAAEGRQPARHHHVLRPALAASAMAPVCLLVLRVHLFLAVAAGAAAYLVTLYLIGGFRFDRFHGTARGAAAKGGRTVEACVRQDGQLGRPFGIRPVREARRTRWDGPFRSGLTPSVEPRRDSESRQGGPA
jgi:O-antigen/teichoic acid export membrane protein